MRSGVSAPLALADTGHGFQAFLRRQAGRLAGIGLFAAVAFALASLGTWNVADPSFSHATDAPVTNAMGYPGAVFSDLAMQFFGLSSVAALVPAVIWGFFFATARGVDNLPRRAAAWFGAALLFAAIAGCATPPETWPLPSGLGGVFGDMMLKIPAVFTGGGYPTGFLATLLAVLLVGAGALPFRLWLRPPRPQERLCRARAGHAEAEGRGRGAFDDDEDDDGGILALGAIAHWWLSARAFLRRTAARYRRHDEFEIDERDRASGWRRAAERVEMAERAEARVSADGRARVEPEFFAAMVSDRAATVDPVDVDDDFDIEDDEVELDEPRRRRRQVRNFRSDAATRVAAPAPRPAPGARVQREAQTSLIGSSKFEMPTLHFLSEPKNIVRDNSVSKDALEQNARLLEGVLEDFGVKGEIIHVRPGPVVTLYELEPAPGIKSSRVIGLADDIARSMSAIAARVAVIPGRNAIGIELPNASRETVYLRELLASRDFETTKAKLALALGKTINGEPVIVDLAKMPHLLVAGTTGSGKSVAINTMILSLLYRHDAGRVPPDHDRPEDARALRL